MFYEHVRRRGYPPKLTIQWIQQVFEKKAWKDHLDPAVLPIKLPTFRLKVKYNEVWETTQARQYRRTLENKLIYRRFVVNKELADSDFLHLCHVQYCKSRLHNIGDFCAKINKMLLKQHYAQRNPSTFESQDSILRGELARRRAMKRLDFIYKARRHEEAAMRLRAGRKKRQRRRTSIGDTTDVLLPATTHSSQLTSRRRRPRMNRTVWDDIMAPYLVTPRRHINTEQPPEG